MSETGNGMGLASVLTTVFIVLKLVGTINWSWWIVLSPLWISAGFVLAIFGIIGIVMLIALLWD